MICIEEQSIVTLWGSLRLCQIVNDMSFWATRILKPKISMYIDQWRSRHMHGFRVDLTRDQVLFETVRKVEEREKQVGLHRSSNLAEIVRMTLMIQEISSVDAAMRSDRGSPSQAKQPNAPLNQVTTPVLNSGLKTVSGSTKGSNKSRNLAAETPSRSGPTKGKSCKNVTPVFRFSGTTDFATTTSSAHSTTTYSATKSSSSSLLTNTPTPTQILSFGARDWSMTTSSAGSAGMSKTQGASITVDNECVTTSTAKSEGLFAKFLHPKHPASQLGDLHNDQVTTEEPKRLNKESNVSTGGCTTEDNTDILGSEWESSKGESDDDKRSSQIIDDIQLFLWPEKC